MMILSLVVMTGLEKYCIRFAYMQWLFHSGERAVARWPLFYVVFLVFDARKRSIGLVLTWSSRAVCILVPSSECEIRIMIARCPITKTRLFNFEPLKPHFYIVKLGFTGVYIIFLMLLKNIDCRYSLEPPRWGGSKVYPQYMFWAGIWKISEFFIWKFSFFGCKIFNIF